MLPPLHKYKEGLFTSGTLLARGVIISLIPVISSINYYICNKPDCLYYYRHFKGGNLSIFFEYWIDYIVNYE